MDPEDPLRQPGEGILYGVAILALRLALIFAVIGAGYAVHEQLGARWFHVFVFLAIAVRLHLELRWIEKNVPPGVHPPEKPDPKDNPFRKR